METIFIRTVDNEVAVLNKGIEIEMLYDHDYTLNVNGIVLAELDSLRHANEVVDLIWSEIKSGNRFIDMSVDILPRTKL